MASKGGMQVFGRKIPTKHPYAKVLSSWLSHPNEEYRAMARNLMHDHRISPEREKCLDRFVKRPFTPEALREGIIRYFEKKVRARTRLHFVSRKVNANNHLPDKEKKKATELVRVLNLNGCPFLQAKEKKLHGTLFSTFPANPNEISDWIEDRLNRTALEKEAFFSAAFAVLKESPRNPVWVTTSEAFTPYEQEPPDRWVQVVGVQFEKPDSQWLMLLKYPVQEVGTLIRPTQLDAGWNARHFPSPPQALHGHPMDLRTVPPPTVLLPEFIHQQIDHTPSHVVKCEKTKGAATGNLSDQRTTHHHLLKDRYDAVPAWMPSPM